MADQTMDEYSGYHSFQNEMGEWYGPFEIFWDDQDFGHGAIARNYDADGNPVEPGWYWWACSPGYLPDGDAIGPFETSRKAWEDAQHS